jgi:hypothetical protein
MSDLVTVDDFYAYMPTHEYIFVPSRLAAGGTEAGEKVLKDANEFYKAIATAAPRFAEAVKTSAQLSPQR